MRPSYEDIRQLVIKARTGCTKSKHELVEAHVGLAIVIAQDFDDDDAILADILCTLVEEVSNFIKQGRDEAALPAYLKKALRNSALSFLRDERRHFARIKKKPIIESYEVDDTFEMTDEILACCESEEETKIVKLRILGASQAEAARSVQLSQGEVSKRLERLEHRYSLRRKLRAQA